jgi:hypothetical protein
MQSFPKENWHLCIFKALQLSKRFQLSWRFISFMALYFIHGALFHSWHFISFMALYFIRGALFHSWRFYFSCIALSVLA